MLVLHKLVNICIFVVLIKGIALHIITAPENTAVESGNSVEMRCARNNTRNDSTLGFWINTATRPPYYYYPICSCNTEHTIDPPCSGSTTSGCVLTIQRASIYDAGWYSCREADYSTHPLLLNNAYALLIVLVTTPQCNTIPSDRINWTDSVEMSCGVSYTGSLAPVMTWFNPIGQQLISDNKTMPGEANYITTVEAEIPSVLSYTCNTKFITPPPPPPDSESGFYADNIPSYSSTCYTQSITVQYPPFQRNITIEGLNGDLYVGAALTCLAYAEPAVFHYEWSDDRGETVGNNYTLLLVQTGQNLNYTCTVCNLLGCSQLQISINVFCEPASTRTTSKYLESTSVGLGVGLGLGLGIPLMISILINGYLIWKMRSKESKLQKHNPDHFTHVSDNLTDLHLTAQSRSDVNDDQLHSYVNFNLSTTRIPQNQSTIMYEELNISTQQTHEYQNLNIYRQRTRLSSA